MPENMVWIDWKFLSRRSSFQPNVLKHWFNWRANRTLDELIEQTQRYQSELNRYYIDRLRFHKYRPTGGIVPFMFVDSNPAIQWSIIDYWRVPKRSYWAMRDAFSPQYAFTLIPQARYHLNDAIVLPVYGVNDAHVRARFRLHAAVYDPEDKRVAEFTRIGEFDGDSLAEELGRLAFVARKRGSYEIRLELVSVGERLVNVYRVPVGRRPPPRNVVQRVTQAIAATLPTFR